MESKFKYFITDGQYNSFYEEKGIVQSQGQPRALINTPDGFQDIAIEYKRDNKWWGVFRNFSSQLGFVKDGRNIVKHIFHKLGVEFKCFLLIYILDFAIDNDYYAFGWKGYYKGEFDLSTAVQENDRITVNLMDGGLEAIIKSKENTVYEIPVEPGHTAVYMDGLNLVNNVQYIITDGFLNDDYPYNKSHLIELQEVSKEVNEIGGTKSVERFKVRDSNTEIKASGRWLMQSTTTKTATFEYDFILTRSYVTPVTTLGMSVRVLIRAIDVNGNNVGQQTIFEALQPFQIIGSTRIAGSTSLSLNPGDEVYLYTLVSPQGDSPSTDNSINCNYSGEGFFKVTYNYKHPATYTAGYHAGPLFKALVDKMTDGKYTADTTWLDKKKEYFLTCGDALRSISTASIKTSFSDFFQWIWSTEDCYFAVVNNKAYIGPMRDLFQLPVIIPGPLQPNAPTLDQSIDLGYVRNLKISINRDMLYSSIQAGYPKQSYEDVNGRSETNQGQNWTTPITRTTSGLDLVSPYRADPYGAEYVRINFGNKTTTDSEGDNETFVLHIEKTPFFQIPATPVIQAYKLDRTANQYTTGVAEPTQLFNIQLSPKHNLLRKGRFLRSVLPNMDAEYIKFQSSDRNKDMVVSYPTGVVKESAHLLIGSLGERYFIPYTLEFETFRPINLVDIMKSNNLKQHCYKISWYGNSYYGFLQTIASQPWLNDVQTVQLISSPKNDLSTT